MKLGEIFWMDQQTVSEVAAMVTDGLLSNEALRNIIEQFVQKGR